MPQVAMKHPLFHILLQRPLNLSINAHAYKLLNLVLTYFILFIFSCFIVREGMTL